MVLFSFLLYTVLGSASGAAEVKFYIRFKSINVSKLLLQNQDMEADGKKSNLLETLLFVFFAARHSLSLFHCCGTSVHASVHFG